ncbi:eCIS core domain-containing protein [Anaeromicropila populeti]|uniref:eCIS core domain-containing protein n=1 Tax=Anaeromicropila populeti TaxID=37658 RepID=A0A1I6HU01_9FIRM|nr:DUF4157 domain-containing protein [Anaeromicropila populeti]SFR57909.1 protein of unknown function [Anaeromicropila populeti]
MYELSTKKSKTFSQKQSDISSSADTVPVQKMSSQPSFKKANQPNAFTNLFTEEPVQRKENHTGLSDDLKSNVENLSGFSMDDVKVHYNSDKPSSLNALAYTQGSEIFVSPGQEQHVAHEAWHVVQQKQGRVQPTTKINDANINDDVSLEHEADSMGQKALQN